MAPSAPGSILERYDALIGPRAINRLRRKARSFMGVRVLHINSTRQGGGVAEILSSLTPLMNELGIATDWHVIEGSPQFFAITKSIHNGLQGQQVQLAPAARLTHRDVALGNAATSKLEDYDVVIVHDPQPLPLIAARKAQIWIWCCHIDLSGPDKAVWEHLAEFADQYDTIVLSLPEYAQPTRTPQRFILPAIDPFSTINEEITPAACKSHISRYGIPTDLPLVVQLGRFDKWKDPQGVVRAFRRTSKLVPARLVLAGGTAADDPEGPAMYDAIRDLSDDRVRVIGADDPLLVNALQRSAKVVLQKSLREGFGLTVSEAMWKRKPVIGGAVGGIRHQIEDGQCGFLVANLHDTTERIARLLADALLRKRMGERARQRVRRHFLMTRLLEDWLDVIEGLRSRKRGVSFS